MADGLPHMVWFPRDFASSTRGWPLEARAIYRELLDAAWDLDGLPGDEGMLRGIAGATEAQWAIGWPFARPKFEYRADGRLANPRMERDREDAYARKAKLSGRARAGADARWHKDASSMPQASVKHSLSIASAMPEAMLEQCPPSPSPSPSLTSPSRSSPSETSPHSFSLQPVAAAPAASAKKGPARRTRIPDDLTLTGKWMETAKTHLPDDCDELIEFERFRAHHTAAGKVMADWVAAWRTWCMNTKLRPTYARKGATHGATTKRTYWQPGDPTGREDGP